MSNLKTQYKNKSNTKIQANDDKQLKILSYYQSTLRNAGMFTTLSLATLAAAHGSKHQKNLWGVYARYIASMMFLSLAIFVSIQLITLRDKYEGIGDPIGIWKWTAPMLLITQFAIFVAILMSFGNRGRGTV
jgi:hypothetical protein